MARGMIADVALHAPGREGDQRNHHAHILLTTREIGPEGFEAKNRDWNAKDVLLDCRSSWADHVNQTLERCHVRERVDHRTLEAQREEALSRAYAAERHGDACTHVAEMARAVQSRAKEWLGRAMEALQERAVVLGPTERNREPQTSLERLQAARAGRQPVDVPQTALERLQAARDGRGRDAGVDVERNEDRAGHELQQQDKEREQVLEQERLKEQERVAAREGPSHSI